jgi:protein gp37
MGANTKIEWTHRQRADGSYIPGHTFNPWIGCEHKVNEDGEPHPGCEHCYAESFTNYTGKAQWGTLEEGGTRTKTSESYWRQPLKWNREAQAAGERQIVFCASFADVFEDWQGPIQTLVNKQPVILAKNGRASDGTDRLTMQDCRVALFQLIDATPWLDWLLLTKRPGNIGRMWRLPFNGREPGDPLVLRRENVWLITSVSNQATLDELWPHLAKCRDLSPVLGLSAEPLLGPLKLPPGVDWVIDGGESGHHARPKHPDWSRSLRDQCQDRGIAYFHKQWGEWAPWVGRTLNELPLESAAKNLEIERDGTIHTDTIGHGGELMARLGKEAAGRLLDGREWGEFPRASAVKS